MSPLVLLAALLVALPVGLALWRRARRQPPAAAAPEELSDPSGPSYPGFRFQERLGTGGMASVYRAERLRDGAVVAIKVPLERHRADALYLRRFHREAHLALRFDHPNVVRTLEHGSDGPHHAMVMEYLAGQPLDHVLEAANIHRDWACAVIAQVARALQHIHEHDIVHRDLKAANVMVMPAALRRLGQAGQLPPGAVKIMDFGIAAAASFTSQAEGAHLGTPIAMSPEQARGERVDHRADIYALGLLAYRLFAGQPPFRGSVEAIMQQQVSHTPPPPSEHRTAVSPQLDVLVMRMIAKDPAGRPSLTEVVAELERFDGLARTQPGRQRIAVLAHEPEVSLWQLDPLSARPPRLLLGPEELGSPVAILPTPDDGWLLLANEGDLAAHGGAFVRRLSADGQTLARYANRGIGPGEVTHAAAMALAPDESVLVIDRDSRRIHRYRSGGGYLAGFGGRGRGRGSFEDPRALAVHHDGKIDVLDAGTNQVQRLHPDGRYDTRWALSGNSREGELLRLTGMHRSAEGRLILAEADTPSLRIIEPNGNLGQTLAFPDANAVRGWVDVVSDPDGAIYVAPRGSTSIARFRGDGELEPVVESPFPIAQLLLLNG